MASAVDYVSLCSQTAVFPVTFEVPKVALLSFQVLWDVTPCLDVSKEQVSFFFDDTTLEDEGCMFLSNGNSSWTPLPSKMKAMEAFKRRVLLRPHNLLR
jgi:hypothetical protein